MWMTSKTAFPVIWTSTRTHKYADDCTQDEVIPYGSTSNMQEVLGAMNDWALRNKMKLNVKNTKDIWICFKAAISEPPSLKIGDDTIERVNSFKLLGLWIIYYRQYFYNYS
jgi:hypothetical protein